MHNALSILASLAAGVPAQMQLVFRLTPAVQ